MVHFSLCKKIEIKPIILLHKKVMVFQIHIKRNNQDLDNDLYVSFLTRIEKSNQVYKNET